MKNKVLIFAILFQILSVCFLYFNSFTILHFGKKVTINASLVDPRSLFRGNFIALSYDFDGNANANDMGQKIYVIFKKDGKIYKFYKTSFLKPKKDSIYISGVFNCFGRGICRENYGIDSYFLPRDKAQIVSNLQPKKILVNLKVLNGRARIENIIVNNKIY